MADIKTRDAVKGTITRDGKVIIFTGSKITGGFCVTTYSLLSNSKLKHILEDCPALRDCLLSEGEFIQYKGRKYAWLDIDKNGVIKLPHSTLAVLDLQSGMELLAIRSSDIAFTIKLWRWYDEQRRKEMCPVSKSKYRDAGGRI